MTSVDNDDTLNAIEWIVPGPIDKAVRLGGIIVVDGGCTGMDRWATDHTDCGPGRYPYGEPSNVPAVSEPITEPAIKVHRRLDDADRDGLGRLLDHALEGKTPLVLVVQPGTRLPSWFLTAWQVVLLAPDPDAIAAEFRRFAAVLALAVRQQGRLAERVSRWRAATPD